MAMRARSLSPTQSLWRISTILVALVRNAYLFIINLVMIINNTDDKITVGPSGRLQ